MTTLICFLQLSYEDDIDDPNHITSEDLDILNKNSELHLFLYVLL